MSEDNSYVLKGDGTVSDNEGRVLARTFNIHVKAIKGEKLEVIEIWVNQDE